MKQVSREVININLLRNDYVTLSFRRVGGLIKTILSFFGLSFLGGGGRGSDSICTMSLYLPFFSFEGAPNDILDLNLI